MMKEQGKVKEHVDALKRMLVEEALRGKIVRRTVDYIEGLEKGMQAAVAEMASEMLESLGLAGRWVSGRTCLRTIGKWATCKLHAYDIHEGGGHRFGLN